MAEVGKGPLLLLFLYFLAVLGLCCGKQSLQLLCELPAVGSVVAGTRAGGLSGGGAWA